MTPNSTYQILDRIGEIYNIPAFPDEFILVDINGVNYLSNNGTELIENSKYLLPFTDGVNTDSQVVSVGVISATSNTAHIALHSSGFNKVMISGHTYQKTSPDTFPFTAVISSNIKILIIYALPTSQIFYLAEGAEAVEAIEPELPAGALIVRRIVVTSAGSEVTVPENYEYREKITDGWIGSGINSDATVSMHGPTGRYLVTANGNFNFKGFRVYEWSRAYDGMPVSIRNDSNYVMTLGTLASPGTYDYPINPNHVPVQIKPHQTAQFALRFATKTADLISAGGGGSSFPEGGTDGQTLVKDSTAETGVKWYSGFLDKITTAVQTVAGLVNFVGFLKSKYYYFTSEASPDTTPGKLSANGTNVQYTNDAGVVYSLAYTTQFYKDITGDVTLDDSYHNCICRITATCIITVPSGLRSDFIAFFVVVGNYTATFTEGLGITFYKPFGNNLREGLTCALENSSPTTFDLIGNLSTW